MKTGVQIMLVLATCAWYALVFISPAHFPYLNIFTGAIPAVIMLHIVLLVIFLPFGIKRVWGILFCLVLSYPFLKASVGISFQENGVDGLGILSYNVNGFNSKISDAELSFGDWVVGHSAEVKVFQEFYTSEKNKQRGYKELLQKQGYNAYVEPLENVVLGHITGMAIFSKYPIVSKGKLLKNQGINNVIYADIVVRGDTLRIYNVHLQSMGINPESALKALKFGNNWRIIINQLTKGALKRATQISKCWDHIAASPYPVIVAGDFNELPYSYAYWKFRRAFDNAFEEKGIGFGFTMNNKLSYLRIDNVFYSKGLEVRQFKTHRDVKYSDHFPISAVIGISKLN